MGKFLKPRGLGGELKVVIFNEENFSLEVGTKIWLKKNEGHFSLNIEKIQISTGKSYIKLVGYNSRTEAEKIQGETFFLPRSEFKPLDENEYYLVDLLGSQVIDKKQNFIGIVIDVLNMPAQNLIVVEKDGDEILIPYVDSHILLFDEKMKKIIVDDIEGLIN